MRNLVKANVFFGPNHDDDAVSQSVDEICWTKSRLRTELGPKTTQGHTMVMIQDRGVLLAKIMGNGFALMHASKELQADHEIVLTAVTKYGGGGALQYASAGLQADHEIVLKAVKNNGDALKYASEKLRADPLFMAKAIAVSPRVWVYAKESVLEEYPFLRLMCGRFTEDAMRAKLEESLRVLVGRLEQWSEVATALTTGTSVCAETVEWIEHSIVAPLHHPGGMIAASLKRKHSELM